MSRTEKMLAALLETRNLIDMFLVLLAFVSGC
jgi:hypothetical protein